MTAANPSRVRIALALLAVYVIWGSTYLAIKFALESFPPFLMAALRFLAAGAAFYGALRLTGVPAPRREEWRGAALVGVLLLAGGNGGVVYAQQTVASGLAALAVASVPIWTVLFGRLWGHRAAALEWAGLAVGFAGIALLNMEGDLRASPAGAAALMFAALAWSFGSAWSRHLKMPLGPMASAAQMLAGGAFLLALSLARGESLPGTPSLRALAALAYLILFGSILAFSAYVYLLRHVRPALATSYAYVNPVIAVVLGQAVADETITLFGWTSMLIILGGVALVALARRS